MYTASVREVSPPPKIVLSDSSILGTWNFWWLEDENEPRPIATVDGSEILHHLMCRFSSIPGSK